MKEIKKYLEENNITLPITIGGLRVISKIFKLLNNMDGFKPKQSPFTLGRNEKSYMEFSVNYIIMKTEVIE